MTQSGALVVLFVFLPVVVGVVVMVLVGRHGPQPPAGTRTSEILAHGERAEGEVLAARQRGTPLFLRPMVEIRLEVSPAQGEAFELTVVQSMARADLHELTPGRKLEVRLGPDRTTGAVVLSDPSA